MKREMDLIKGFLENVDINMNSDMEELKEELMEHITSSCDNYLIGTDGDLLQLITCLLSVAIDLISIKEEGQ